jgi:DNA-binding beta-propeller fold protein YncE
VTTLAGGSEGTSNGYGTFAKFESPSGIALNEATFALYVADKSSNSIRLLALESLSVSTISTGSYHLQSPTGLCLDSNENLLIADTQGNRIILLTQAGAASVFVKLSFPVD